MASVKVYALLLIILMNKLTVRKWTNPNCLKLNLNLKERKELFMNPKSIKVRAT